MRLRPELATTLLNIALPYNQERRRQALILAIGLAAWGVNMRKMLGLPAPTEKDAQVFVDEYKRWHEDLTW